MECHVCGEEVAVDGKKGKALCYKCITNQVFQPGRLVCDSKFRLNTDAFAKYYFLRHPGRGGTR